MMKHGKIFRICLLKAFLFLFEQGRRYERIVYWRRSSHWTSRPFCWYCCFVLWSCEVCSTEPICSFMIEAWIWIRFQSVICLCKRRLVDLAVPKLLDVEDTPFRVIDRTAGDTDTNNVDKLLETFLGPQVFSLVRYSMNFEALVRAEILRIFVHSVGNFSWEFISVWNSTESAVVNLKTPRQS